MFYLRERTVLDIGTHYEKNPNFLKSEVISKLDFKAHPELKKQDIKERKELVMRICEQIWSTEYYKLEKYN